jgi:hypothetical protein
MTVAVAPSESMDAEFVLGFDELPAGRRRQLQRFLLAVLTQRRVPLHFNCLWNALYYRWDLDTASYPTDAINIDMLYQAELGQVGPALPVGAFAYLPTPTSAGDLVGEVVAKSGWHPELTDDGPALTEVPPTLAGAPAATARLHERLVVDFELFPDLNTVTPVQLRRMRDRGVWIDELGHLVYDATYPSVDAADQDDTSFYIDWLLTHRRAGLLDWAFDLPDGVTLDPDELDQAVSATFATLEALLDDIPEVIRWGDVFWTEDAYRRYVGTVTADGDGPLNRGKLDELTRIVASTYGEPVRYTAIAAEIDLADLDPERRDATLGGTGWVAAVVAANLWLAEQLDDRAAGGIVATVDGPVHVRLDDRWQHGGLWRTEPADDPSLLWYLRAPLDRPLGLGAGVADAATVPDEPSHADDDEVETLSDTEAVWTVVLHADDFTAGRLPVPPEVARHIPTGPVAVRLTHRTGPAGLTDTTTRAWQTRWRYDDKELTGLGWPASLPVGIRLHCRLPLSGQTVDIETRRLDVPITVGDVELAHDHDPTVVQAVTVRDPRRQQQKLLADRATVIFDTVAPAPDGSAQLEITTLCQLLFGPNTAEHPSRLLDTFAIADLLGLETRGTRFVRRRTAPPTARKVATLDEPTKQELGALVRRSTERMRLTRLQPGQPPPAAAAYATDRKAAGETTSLPADLPAGYTYVKPRRVQGATNQHALGVGDGEVDYFAAGKDWD